MGMTRRTPFTARRECHQKFCQYVGECLTGGPAAQADATVQFHWDTVSVPEDWADQQGYAIDAPSGIPAGSVWSDGVFRDLTYVVRG